MYGLIGYPLGHSFSEEYFSRKFRIEKIPESYRLMPLPDIDMLPDLLVRERELRGFNVTVPHKESVIPYLDSLSEEASEIGAVNCVRIIRNGGKPLLVGHNTDWRGFSSSLEPLLHPDIREALVLGTGGASKAVAYALDKLGIKTRLVSRTEGKGDLTYSELRSPGIAVEAFGNCLLIVNTTPLGMAPDTAACPAIPYEYIDSRHLCYDLVYNPGLTLFLKNAESRGARIKNGLEMLHRQADISWEIWNA